MPPKHLSRIAIIPIDLALLISLASCGDIISDVINGITNEATAAVSSYEPPSTSSTPYNYVSTGQRLTEHQLIRLFYLSWPQSGKAMYSLLGPPDNRTGAHDYYVMPNGNLLSIQYNATGYAIDYHLGDSN